MATSQTQAAPQTAPTYPEQVTGMDILVRALRMVGIDTMYGLVGIPVTELAYIAQARGIRFVGFRHEQQAGMAAATHGYLTRTPGVLLTVSSLGFMNGLTATTNATVNCYPMIQISGSSVREPIDLLQGTYEGLDQLNIAKPLVKAAYRVNKPEDIPTAVVRAYRAAVLQAFTKAEIPMPYSGRWANAGMVRGGGVDLAWCVYDAQYFGTAQRRRRLFLVCDFAGRSAGEILFVPKSLRGYFEAGGTPRQGLTAFAESRPDTAGGEIVVLNDQGGASLTVERSGLSPTLRSQTHGNLPVVAAGFDLQQITSKTNRSTLRPVQPTLCGTGQPHVVTMATGQANAEVLADIAPTLNCNHEQPLLVHPQIAGTLCASGAGLSRPAGMGSETDFCITRYTDLIVRRLTPLECERLQGFPDFWTEQGGGRAISDTSRYQMLGNSIAVPCVAYIMQGIYHVLERRN